MPPCFSLKPSTYLTIGVLLASMYLDILDVYQTTLPHLDALENISTMRLDVSTFNDNLVKFGNLRGTLITIFMMCMGVLLSLAKPMTTHSSNFFW